MKKMNAFTLTEVLLTLSIVGVVAALTLPQLVTKIQGFKSTSTLARTVKEFELGSQKYFEDKAKNDKATAYAKFSDAQTGLADIVSYWGLVPTDGDTEFNLSNYNDYAYVPTSSLLPSAYAAISYMKVNLKEDSLRNDSLAPEITPGYGDDDILDPWHGPVKLPPIDSTSGGKVTTTLSGFEAEKGTGLTWNPNNPGNDVPSDSSTEEPTSNSSTPETTVKVKTSYSSKKAGGTIFFESNDFDYSNSSEDAVVISFYLDVNGYKNKPNMKGKDLFKFNITNSGTLIPEGLLNNEYKTECADGNVKDGLACTARVVLDGYKIKY